MKPCTILKMLSIIGLTIIGIGIAKSSILAQVLIGTGGMTIFLIIAYRAIGVYMEKYREDILKNPDKYI